MGSVTQLLPVPCKLSFPDVGGRRAVGRKKIVLRLLLLVLHLSTYFNSEPAAARDGNGKNG
jgi:hypothetical protein